MAFKAKTIPDRRETRVVFGAAPIHVTLDALELETLADAQAELVDDWRRARRYEQADLLEARTHELRRLAVAARAAQ